MMLAYICDFISFLFEGISEKEIKNIILYGSVASGESDEQSDIDIFIEIWDKNRKAYIEKKIKEQLAKFEDIAARIWYPRGIKNKFSVIVDDLNSPKWKNVKYDIISNGILLYGKFESVPEKMEHKVLINFSLSKMKQKEKMKFIRELYGYELKVDKKKYKRSGLLEKYEGIKLSSNSILIPIEKIKEFRKLFSEFRLTPEIREVWIKP